ncbi:hypothetical protein GZH53_09405 [Flavihumibacter sp. R14]|nr:hypothetical protein [Flavihumibacter soli]
MEILIHRAYKHKIIIVLMILIANSFTAFAQTKSLNSFKSYVTRSYRITDSVYNDCNWNYAVVKASVGSSNTVENLTILNDDRAEMKESFSFIRGYSFGSDRTYKGKAVIFILTVELDNWRTCNTVKVDYTSSEAITRVLSFLDEELSLNPSSVVLYNPITVTRWDNRH